MAIRAPVAGKRDLSSDPWMTLGEAVRWAAWRGQSEPPHGVSEFEDGTWISHGDMDGDDLNVYRSGADKVRAALAKGQLVAWAQIGYEEPIQLPKARWSELVLGSVVSWTEFYHPYDRIIVERATVQSLWPPVVYPFHGIVQGEVSNNASSAWISLPDAIRELHHRVEAAVPDSDPAPWFDVPQVVIEMFCQGDEATFVRSKKMGQRSMLIMQRALLSGSLRAHFSDGLDSCDAPGWAWEGAERNEQLWFEGRLPLDVFLPEEWQRWSCHAVYLVREAFTKWMDRQPLHDSRGLPELPPPFDEHSKPEAVKKRLPPDTPFVTLSEALTWIAFGFALDSDRLDRAISGHAIVATDPQVALADAVAKLAVWASGGQIAARGKYVESHATDEHNVLTAPIDPVRFEDFAQFDIFYDGLRYGTGLTWEKRNNTLDRVLQVRGDAFRSVKVSRTDLLKLFPDQDDTVRAFLGPLPASLPGIGPVIGLEEALSWLAHGKPSYDVAVWQNAAGDLIFRDPSGAVIEPRADGAPPPFMETYLQASRTMHSTLRDGNLPTYVAPASGTPLLVPRHYWNGVNPENLHQIYRGMTPDDHGAGCPILLSRLAFHKWRGALRIPHSAKAERAPSVKAGRPPSDDEILAKADEMKARGLDGRTIAKEMRLEPGFENVATTAVRDLIKGRWKPSGRPKKDA